MRLLLIVNTSPWGSTLAATALRFARAASDDGDSLAVYFQGEGVYNAIAGSVNDAGAVRLCAGWVQLAEARRASLLLCSAAAARRFPDSLAGDLPPVFQVAGLAVLLEQMAACDRLVSF